MYANYSTKVKLVIIALTLISSISFNLSLNKLPVPQVINNLAFAQQNPILPNYKGNHQALESSNTVDNKANLASSEIQPNSLVHYQPITPASNYYTGSSNEATTNSFRISTTNMVNSTNPAAGIVQPVSLVHYQPIIPADSEDPITSTNSVGPEHTSTNDNGGGHHSSNNDSNHNGGSHSDSTHHKSSSNHDNSSHGGGTSSHHSSHHSGSHDHGGASASASASAGGGHGGASASASASAG
jgi:hypothetical protein